jgi:hypothetical protein
MVALSMTAQAADTSLTLVCKGTEAVIIKEGPEPVGVPISMGIIVNFTNRTVQGFGGLVDFPVKITDMNEVTVSFYGEKPKGPNAVIDWSIHGTIDRVTGDVEYTDAVMSLQTSTVTTTQYSLKCRPAQRMF